MTSPLPKMAMRNVAKNARRSAAALTSISAGFFAIATFAGYVSELEVRFADVIREKQMLGDLIIERRGAEKSGDEGSWQHTFDEQEQKLLEGLFTKEGSGVAIFTKSLSVSGLVTSGRKTAVFLGFGYHVPTGTQFRGKRFEHDVSWGRTLAESKSDKAMIAGEGLARLLGCVPSDAKDVITCKRKSVQLAATTQDGQLNAIDAEIVGIVVPELKEMNVRFLSMPLELAQRLMDTKRVSRYVVKLDERTEHRGFGAQLVTHAEALGLTLEARAWDEHRFTEMYKQAMSMLAVLRAFVAFVVITVAGMSVFNTMAKVVNERVREIGALRALGFLRRQIVALFVLEGTFLGLLGVSIGAAGSLVFAVSTNLLGLTYDAGMTMDPIELAIAVHGSVYALAATFLLTVGLIAAWLPARRAARLAIPEALSHV